MKYQHYAALKKRVVPRLRFNQEFYEETVTKHVSEDTIWLDAGCGKHIFPIWRDEAERSLVAKASIVLGCDADYEAIRKHKTLSRLVASDLTNLPFNAASVSLITCNMVVEHLEQPPKVFSEFARVLMLGGRVIIHTPNVYSYAVVGSRLFPIWFKRKLLKTLGGRPEEDVFPTRYRANTARKLKCLMGEVGLETESCRMVASDASLQGTHQVLLVPELLYIRMTLRPALRYLRASILAIFTKADGQERVR